MRTRIILIAIGLTLLVPVFADAQFKSITRAIDHEIGGDRIWIPFKGLMRLYVRSAHPEGIRDMQLAIFEDAGLPERGAIESIFQRKLDSDWQRFVRVSGRDEEVLIYARPVDDEVMEMMIFAFDYDETVVMEVELDVDRFIDGLDDPDSFISIGR